MQTMYPAIVNSPLTLLVAAIDDTQDTIEVADGSKLPDAPNLATIGGGENAETVLYTGKSGNTLTGVTRGFQGTARAWSTGTQVGRFFTEYDYRAMIENIEEMSAQIGEGTPFQTTVLPGLNIITVPRSTPLNVLNIKGRTLVNLLGRLGRTATSATITVDSIKRYLIINEGGTSVTVNGASQMTPYKVTGVTSLALSWASGEKVAVYDITGDTTIDSLTNAQINAKYPYVDDIKGVRNPYIIRYGKNLLPPFTEW
ncbi:hypothetical protein P4S89_18980, partial [Aneurinibacillus thermoaerophilus]|nr:hypothetical protein [Aneurinibacillus thermoaerophilus]